VCDRKNAMQQNTQAELEEQVQTCTAQLQAALTRVEQQTRYLEIIKQVVQLIHTDVAVENLLQTTVDLLAQALQASCGLLLIPHSKQRRLGYVSQCTAEPDELLAVCSTLYYRYEVLLAQGKPVVLPCLGEATLFQSVSLVPILWQQELWGEVMLHSGEQERQWTEDELAFVQTVANHCAIAIHRRQLIQQVQQAEDTRRTVESQFQTVFEQTFQFTGLLTTEGILLAVNQTALNFGGLQRADVVNRPVWEARWWTIGAETQEQLKKAITCAAQGMFVRYEVDVLGKGDSVVTIDFSLKPVKDETGQVVLLIPEGRDITQLKQTAQQELNQQTTEILESITDAFVAVDGDWRLTYMNPQAESLMFNRSREQLIGKSVWEVYPEAVNTRFYQELQRAITEQVTVHFEEFYPPCDRTFRVHAYPAKQGLSIYYRDVTEHKQAQQERDLLRKERDRFFNLSLDMLVIGNFDGYLTHLNPAWERTLGFTLEELKAQPFWVWVHPQDWEVTQTAMAQLEEGIPVKAFEHRYRCRDGSYKWLSWTAVPFLEEGLIYAVTREVTERKQVEAALKQSEQKYRNLVETCQGMIWSIDTEGRFTFVNQAVKQLHGYEPEELLGRKFSEFTTPEQAQKEWEVFERVLAGECFIQHEAEYLHKDGTPFYVSINAIALRDDAGNVLGTTGTILDITNLKRTEAALRQSEAKLSTILNSAIAVIANFRLFANREWEYDYYSSGAEALYGYTPEELMTDKTLWMSRVFPEDLDTVILPGFEDIFAERPIRVEYRFWHKDGTLRWFSASVFSQRDEVSDCWVVTTVDSDISDAKAAATLRKQAEEQLKLSLQEKEALLKEVHHRVKNNLQVISSLLDLQASHIQEPQTLEAFQIIQNRVKSISLVHKKLYRSKSLAQVNLADYIDNLTTHLIQTYTLNSDDITLQLRLDEVLCNLDTAIPCGLLINELVSNALKHGFPGNSRGSIWVELNTVGVVSPQNAQQVRLIVGNDGLKFPELSNLSEAESVGFQLIQALIQQIHGQMEIDESRGTEFKITFVNLGT